MNIILPMYNISLRKKQHLANARYKKCETFNYAGKRLKPLSLGDKELF